MARKTYREKLKDPRWQKKRLEIMQRDDFSCTVCSGDDATLHVHHGYYEKGLEPWEYPDETLHTVCEECHPDAQAALLVAHRLLGSLPPELVWEACGHLVNSLTLMDPQPVALPPGAFESRDLTLSAAVARPLHGVATEDVLGCFEGRALDLVALSLVHYHRHLDRKAARVVTLDASLDFWSGELDNMAEA